MNTAGSYQSGMGCQQYRVVVWQVHQGFVVANEIDPVAQLPPSVFLTLFRLSGFQGHCLPRSVLAATEIKRTPLGQPFQPGDGQIDPPGVDLCG